MYVQIATDDPPSNWTSIKTNVYVNGSSGTKKGFDDTIILNNPNVKYVRFLKTYVSSGTARVLFDNIAVTPMPARVIMGDPELSPANPSQSSDITFHISVATDTPFAAPDSTAVKLRYQLTSSSVVQPSATGWSELSPVASSVDGDYTFTLPAFNQVGHLWYYFECDFEGYHFGSEDNFSPAFRTVGGTTWKTAPTSDFFELDINEFSADFESVSFDGAGYAAKLVGDNIWELTARVKGLDSVAGHIVGTKDGETYVWGDASQSSAAVPFGGTLTDGAPDIAVTNDAAYTHLVFTVDTANLTYAVEGTNVPVVITFANDSISADAQTNGEKSNVSVNLFTSDGSLPRVAVVFRNHISSRGDYSDWTTNSLAVMGDGTAFLASGKLPALLDDSIQYYFLASDEKLIPVPAGDVTTSATNTIVVSAKPGDTRYTGFDGWVAEGNPLVVSNWTMTCENGGSWVGTGIGINTLNSFKVNGKPLPVALLRNYPLDTEASVTSPVLDGGVGSIFFESRMADASDGEMSIQVTTVDNPSESDWQTVEVIKYAMKQQNTVHNTPVTLNRYDIKRVRFIRTGSSSISNQATDGMILLDEVVISRPPTDVRMEKFLNEPGYPSQYENIKMRCRVDDESADTPAVNRRITLYYQHTYAEDDIPVFNQLRWTKIPMTDTGDNHYFECYIPTQEVGYVWYYFKADFDGYRYDSREDKGSVYLVDGVNGYGNSPATGKGETPLNKDSDRLQIRPFMSPDGSVIQYATCTPTDADDPVVVITNELKLVGHNQWQSLLDISRFAHVESYFYAYDHYNTGADYFEPRPRIWGETDQGDDECTAPLGNYLEMEQDGNEPAQLNPLVVTELEKDGGSLLFRFSTDDRYYIVKRAVYQDFDEWQASEDNYEESLGGSETINEETSFDDWSLNAYTKGYVGEYAFTPFYVTDGPAENFETRTILCDGGNFNRTQSRIIEERKTSKTALANYALSLKKVDGNIVNNGSGYTRGVEKLTFRARSTIDDDNFALYKDGTETTLPLYMSAEWNLSKPGPSQCYLSYIFLYKPDMWAGTASWYEYRIIQADGTDADTGVRVELVRHESNGTETTVGEKTFANKFSLAAAHTISLRVKSENNSIKVAVDFNGKGNYGDEITDASSAGVAMGNAGGTIGFGVYDAVPSISASTIKVGTTTTNNGPGTEILGGTGKVVNSAFFANNWYNGGNNRWTFTGGNITRSIPSQTIEILYAPNENYAPAVNPADLVVKETKTVNSLEYQEFDVGFRLWNPQFIQISYASGDAGVVIDDPTISAWRGWTRGKDIVPTAADGSDPSYDWSTVSEQNDWIGLVDSWAVLQGEIEKSVGVSGNSLCFEPTRACPPTKTVGGRTVNLPIQGLVSPKLDNGVGSIKFTAQAAQGRCVYAVEVTDPVVESQWWTKAVFTNDASVSGEAVRRFISIRQLKEGQHIGRIRIRLIPELSSENAKLVIDNVTAKDYPPRDEATWIAWNARITANSDDPPLSSITDPTRIYNASGKSCFLNNSLVNGCADEDFSAHEPYIQSPEVGTGIGEISFQYRCFANNNSTTSNTNAAILTIKCAADEGVDEEDWVTITNMEVTGTAYVTFQNEKIFDREHKVVRFYSSTNSAERICIDNLLISEPVRASFEFFNVRLLPEQPIVGSNSVIEAEIGRFLMKPRDIEIYVSVYEGTNVWGYKNWWTRNTTADCKRYKLMQVGDDPNSRVYRSPTAVMPAKAIDDVVQYVVWGTHREIGPADEPIFMTADALNYKAVSTTLDAGEIVTVTNTVHYVPWYLPVDLNKTCGSEAEWSPYYFVYSCAPGSIWFNEISYLLSSYPDAGEFIELLGYGGIDIGNWTIELIDPDGSIGEGTFGSVTIPAGTRLASSAVVDDDGNPRNVKGWGVYVIGDRTVDGANLKLEKWPDDDDDDSPYMFNYYSDAGLVLKRSNGSYEQRVCFGSQGYVTSLIRDGFEYINQRYTGRRWSHSLSAGEGAKSYADFEWLAKDMSVPTPGQLNVGEIDIAELGGDDVTTYIFISVLHGLYGTQAYGEEEETTQVITKEVESGASVTVSYAADEWYRIEKLESAGAAVAAAAGAKAYTFEIASMSGDVSNDVWIAELPAASRYNCPVSWLSRWTEEAIGDGDGDDLDIFDEYLLNTDPTVYTDYSLKFSGILVGDSGTTLGVELTRTEGNKAITEEINGAIGIYGFDDLGDLGDLENASFHGQLGETFAGNTVTEETLTTGTARFFKAVVEEK